MILAQLDSSERDEMGRTGENANARLVPEQGEVSRAPCMTWHYAATAVEVGGSGVLAPRERLA